MDIDKVLCSLSPCIVTHIHAPAPFLAGMAGVRRSSPGMSWGVVVAAWPFAAWPHDWLARLRGFEFCTLWLVQARIHKDSVGFWFTGLGPFAQLHAACLSSQPRMRHGGFLNL